MARKNRRRRSYRGFGEVVGLNLNGIPLINESVSGMDVFVGGIAGLVASAAVKAAVNKFAPDMWAKIPAALAPVVGAGAGAAALYYVNAKGFKNAKRGAGHAVGAASVGLALAAMEYLKTNNPFESLGLKFNDVVGVDMARYQGLLVADGSDGLNQGYQGLLVADRSDALNELGAMDMGIIEDDGMDSLAQF